MKVVYHNQRSNISIGLINKVMPRSELMNEVEHWVGILLERGPLALRAAKSAVINGWGKKYHAT